MATTRLSFEADIQASAERVFSMLVELRDYDRWLPPSSAFHGTTTISAGPIAVGTTYTEPGPFGTRHGRLTRLERPTELDFEQPMTMRPAFVGVIGIRLFHMLTPTAAGVHVLRRLELTPQGPVAWFIGPVVRQFRAENERMMALLKQKAERDEHASHATRS